jgi:ABC-type nickel/cobalt efflux system permease component RcnA
MLRQKYRRPYARPALLALVGLWLLLSRPIAATAHPLGNFTVNLYSRLEPATDRIDIVYVIDLSEVPTFQQFGAKPLSPDAYSDFLTRTGSNVRDRLQLTVDGQPAPLEITGQRLSFPPGQAKLFTTRIELGFRAALTGAAQHEIAYADANYPDRLGWHEIVVRPAPNIKLLSPDAPTADLSNELRSYPQDMLSSPIDMRSVQLTIAPGAATTAAAPAAQTAITGRAPDRFAELIAIEQRGPLVLALALLAAVGLGAAHAFTPGHGKTIVAAYLIGARGTARHALFLGFTVTATHTLGVFALGLITLYASRYILPQQLYPWLEALSGVLVIGMGVMLLRQRLRAALGRPAHDHSHHHHDHDHDHDHSHDHDHHHTHDHDHVHDHTHPTLPSDPRSSISSHSHLPPGADGAPVTWRSLLALGISGGLLPCPSALIVMLSAISLGRVGFGLLLIIAFSLGLAGVLTGVGLLFVYGGRWISRLSREYAGLHHPLSRWALRLVPVASALVVTTAGLLLTMQAVAQTGVLR